MQENEKKRERSQPLLAVDEKLLAVTIADNDRAEKVMAVSLYSYAFVFWFVTIEKHYRQVIDQLRDMFGLPTIFSLIVINGVFRAAQQSADTFGVASDFFHGVASFAMDSMIRNRRCARSSTNLSSPVLRKNSNQAANWRRIAE